MIYGYCRVSTKGQIDNNSFVDQKKLILESYPTAKIYEEAYSGAKEREIFSKLIEKLKEGDILVVTKLDRFCRSTKEGLEYIDILLAKKVKIHILNMGLIENTPLGRMLVTNLLAFAEFERAMIIERTQAGKAIAKQDPNYREGRPKKFMPEQIDHAISLLEKYSYRAVERMTGISKSTIYRAKLEKKKLEQKI